MSNQAELRGSGTTFIDVLGHALSVGKDMVLESESLLPERRVLYAIIVLEKR